MRSTRGVDVFSSAVLLPGFCPASVKPFRQCRSRGWLRCWLAVSYSGPGGPPTGRLEYTALWLTQAERL